VTYAWRGEFENTEVEALHAAGFGHEPVGHDWWAQLSRHSLGWVCARESGTGPLAGFVNVAWDGAGHAFVLDTVVATDGRHQGVGVGLIVEAERRARAAGCEWLHVDFEEHLAPFYFDACGFRATPAGLIRLAD
jgi:ribosomal protein S18 acetylase RimI-like enzyme